MGTGPRSGSGQRTTMPILLRLQCAGTQKAHPVFVQAAFISQRGLISSCWQEIPSVPFTLLPYNYLGQAGLAGLNLCFPDQNLKPKSNLIPALTSEAQNLRLEPGSSGQNSLSLSLTLLFLNAPRISFTPGTHKGKRRCPKSPLGSPPVTQSPPSASQVTQNKCFYSSCSKTSPKHKWIWQVPKPRSDQARRQLEFQIPLGERLCLLGSSWGLDWHREGGQR